MNIVSDIYEVFENKEKRPNSGCHYPSSALDCHKKLCWQMNNEPVVNKPNGANLLNMELGNLTHNVIADILKVKYPNLKTEVEVKVKHMILEREISGRMDIMLDDKIAIEIKSTFGGGINSVKENGPKEEHMAQCALYLYLTNIEQITLLYVDRGSGYALSFDYFKSNNDLKDIYEKCIKNFKIVETYLAKGELPERPYKVIIQNGIIWENVIQRNKVKYKSDWHCLYCPYNTKCWEDQLVKYATSDNIEEYVGGKL